MPIDITPDDVRPWIILSLAILLIAAGLLRPDPTIVFLGSTMLGIDPMIRAHKSVS